MMRPRRRDGVRVDDRLGGRRVLDPKKGAITQPKEGTQRSRVRHLSLFAMFPLSAFVPVPRSALRFPSRGARA